MTTEINLIKAGKLKANFVDKETVNHESYYNLIQLCNITHYSNPIAALKTTGEVVRVSRDDCGNILSGEIVS